MKHKERMSLEEIKRFINSTQSLEFQALSQHEKYKWIERTLEAYKYLKLGKREKGILRAYMMKITGISSSQLTRLIWKFRQTGEVKWKEWRRHRFPRRYTSEDISLLVKVDEAHERLSGPATKEIIKREYELFAKEEYQRLKDISVSHLYNLRKSFTYRNQTVFFRKTKANSVKIGERKRPQPEGRPGYLRVDTVHQGDRDGKKGIYHINTICEVTQWEIVGCVERISERFLLPILEDILEQYPFRIKGFHADNGSEYINKIVADLLNKMLIELTKTRPRKTNDNALVESKNGSIIRKHMGYAYIPKSMAQLINKFYKEYLNVYLNYHRPCGFATIKVDGKGKEKKKYDTYMTPYEKLKSIPNVRDYLKEGISLEMLDEIAYKESDVEFALKMQKAKDKLFEEIINAEKISFNNRLNKSISCSSLD